MKKFQSLSDFQALPENQMKKTVGGFLFPWPSFVFNITGPGYYEGDSEAHCYSWTSDYNHGDTGIEKFGIELPDFC